MENKHRGFTLVELLVVIAIIAILAAVLMPVFARAKTASKKAVALVHLKQWHAAWSLYAADADDTACPSYYFAAGEEVAWDFAVRPGSWRLGLLGPYHKAAELARAPGQTTGAWGRPHTGYAYNTSYIGGDTSQGTLPVSLSRPENPSETVLFATGGFGRPVRPQNYLRAPSDPLFIGGMVHYRYDGAAVWVAVDGHAVAARQRFRSPLNSPALGSLSLHDELYDLD